MHELRDYGGVAGLSVGSAVRVNRQHDEIAQVWAGLRSRLLDAERNKDMADKEVAEARQAESQAWGRLLEEAGRAPKAEVKQLVDKPYAPPAGYR